MTEQLSHAWWLILISVVTSVAGQTVLKLGTAQSGEPGDHGLGALVRLIATTPLVWLGLLLYGIGAFAWIAVLRRMDLGYAYPFLALNFVLITLVSALFLGEPTPLLRWGGVALIVVGILLVAQAGR